MAPLEGAPWLAAGQSQQGTHRLIHRLCQLLSPAPLQQAHLGGDLGWIGSPMERRGSSQESLTISTPSLTKGTTELIGAAGTETPGCCLKDPVPIPLGSPSFHASGWYLGST